MKKVLIHSLIFSPDGVSTAYLYNDIALKFKECGYEVVILTTTPHFNLVEEDLERQPIHWKIWGVYKESSFHGLRVIHVPQKKFKSTLLRLLGFVYWHIVSFLIALFERKIDLILSPSPPLTIGFLNILLAKIKRCKTIYNVQEIYPDILGLNNGLILRSLSSLERYIYNNSTAVITIDQVFYDTIVDRFKDRKKLHVIPNFVDTSLYRPYPSTAIHLNEKLFPKGEKIRIVYAGNIGYAQDWDVFMDLVRRTYDLPIEYIVIGEGVMKKSLEDFKKKENRSNFHLLPYQPRELMPQILAYSDLQFIFMTKEMQRQGFPSKVYTIMSCAKPLLVSSGEHTPIINFLTPIGCAKLITDTTNEDKVNRMYDWLSVVNKSDLYKMGLKGKEVVDALYTKEKVTQKYIDLAGEILTTNI